MATARDRARIIGQQIRKDVDIREFNSHASKEGEYVAQNILGAGYFGTVFLATSRSGQKVAIKITNLSSRQLVTNETPSKYLRALNEVKCLNQLCHPYIIQLLDAYIFNSANGGKGIAIVMEYCPKGNLQQFLEKYRPGVDRRFKWCQQLAEAMKYIHSKAIMHRDIKPDNILIDSKDNIRIADVGIAKPAWEFATGLMGITDIPYESYICSMVAPPPYIAPEVFDRHYHRQSDIFSLGLVFVMIVEAPGNLIPYARYDGERKVLGQLLHDNARARNCNPTGLLEVQFTHASSSEVRLFDKMLAADYHQRPTSNDALEEINTMNRSRGIVISEVPTSTAPAPQSSSGCWC